MSAGVYRKLIGKILTPGGVVRREGLKGRIPLPFVVVHSGYTTITRFEFSLMSVPIFTSFAFFGGLDCGTANERNNA